MSEIDWKRVEEVFAEAVASEPAGRAAYLDSACRGDGRLRAEVEALLASHANAQAAGFSVRLNSTDGGQLLSALRTEFIVGQRLGPYLVEQYLGEGGMGVVYRASDSGSGRTVAIKLLPGGDLSGEQRRLEREAAAAARIRHPGIVPVEGLFRERDLDFLVMEYVPGDTLGSMLAAGPLPLATTLDIGAQCAEALSVAHQAGIIHRDLKPSNIMVTNEGVARLLDFGLCRFDPENSARSLYLSMSGGIVGTASYMSPEQAEGLTADCRSDVFSLGAVLYEMLSGVRAFDAPTRMATVARVLRDSPPRLPPRVPHAVERLVARCLEKQPDRRYQTAADLAAELSDLRKQAGLGKLRPHRRIPWTAAAVVAFAAVLAAAVPWLFRKAPPARDLTFTQLTRDTGLTTDPGISRDGKLLAFASDRAGEGTLDIWLQPLPSGEPVRLTHHETDDREPAISPDGAVLAYRSERDGGIYTVPIRGGPERKIAEGRRPRYSPDGKWIAYWTGFEDSGDLFAPGASRVFIVPAGGGAPRQMVPQFSAAALPVWSPDSSALLFAGQPDSHAETGTFYIWVVPISGGPPIRAGAEMREVSGWPSDWTEENRVLFFTMRIPGLWEIGIRTPSMQFYGSPRRLTPGTTVEWKPVTSRAGAMAFAGLTQGYRIALLPLEGGPLQSIEVSAGLHLYTSVTSDGNTVLYDVLADRSNDRTISSLALHDVPGDVEKPLIKALKFDWSSIGPGGDQVFYQSQDQIYRVRLGPRGEPSQPVSLCPCHEHVWDISPDGRYLLSLSGSQPKRIEVTDLTSCRTTELVARPGAHLYHGAFSGDGKWILFAEKNRPDRLRLYAARYQPGRAVQPDDWIAITEGQAYDGPAHWSADGNRIYFLSNRDGFSCLWMRALGRDKRPSGGPVAVRHFHSAARYSNVGFTVSRKNIVFTIQERMANIWIANPR